MIFFGHVTPAGILELDNPHLMIAVLLAGSLIALSTMEAGAVVCARGVVRAGCVAADGAAVVTTAPVVTAPVAPPAGAVVVPRAPVVRRRVY
jgi:hypothetical protein